MSAFTQYPWPEILTYDRGSEFKAKVAQMVENNYGILGKPITAQNPQSNAIIKRVHKHIGQMIQTFEVYDNEGLDETDPWSGILAATMAAVRSTVSTTTKATPMQLVFGRDAILNEKFTADWELIR